MNSDKESTKLFEYLNDHVVLTEIASLSLSAMNADLLRAFTKFLDGATISNFVYLTGTDENID